ncbi:carbohydrate ABC transporter permease [Microlunatus sp. Y2014]|uniref:carbohydrate ABC transporter permease n=1 Tax=Microlunatus sp. Y2014 TaxID=3418488 RepID=UPI003DA79C2D
MPGEEVAGRRRRWQISPRTRREWWVFVLFALPNLALITTFTYVPLFTNVYYSTLNLTIGSATAVSVGLQNYTTFFTSPNGLAVWRTTAIFTVATVGGSIVIGLLVSLVLNQNLRGRTVARAAVFSPYVLSGVGVGLVWLFIFDPVFGVLGHLLRSVGLTSPEWFLDPDLSLAMVIIVYVWKNLGYCAVVYLAGLQSLPRDVMEAAALDGAGAFSRFTRIALPLLSPSTFFLLITCILNSLQAFDLLRIMTPLGNGTNTLIFEAYLQSFGAYQRAGYSAAIAVVLFAVLLIMTLVQLRFVEKRVHYA